MARLPHGKHITTEDAQESSALISKLSADVPLAFAMVQPAELHAFDFLFPALQADPDNLLPEDPGTFAKLVNLGRTMHDRGRAAPDDPGDGNIPAAYTYFSQFVDHDLTLEASSAKVEDLVSATLTPMPIPQIRSTLKNLRTATLDLDNLYSAPAPRDATTPDKMALGRVSPTNSSAIPFSRPAGKGDDNDVPREPRNAADPDHDRAALIGDPRDDENTIIAQLQVAMLKAHNRLVDEGHTFEEAKTILRRHYQHVVIHDYLRRVADPTVVDDILQNGPKAFDPPASNFFMPLEFSAAIYRFGHTMVRNAYNFNVNFNFSGPPAIGANLGLLFTFAALNGQLGGFDTLPENWIIEWERLIDDGTGAAFDKTRRMDTKLVEFLFDLRNVQGTSVAGDGARLAVRNLLRGYLLRMPTGQAVAAALGIPALKPVEIEQAAADADQLQALVDGGFSDRTPLWYYILAEANHFGGNHLGPVGSTVVADVLIGLARRSADSIFDVPDWRPTLPSATPGTFELRDLLAFAGVLPTLVTQPQPEAQTYVVEPGDTLSGIAQKKLGDGNRWPQIFALNRDQIGNPDLIFPGQVLRLPDPSSTDPVPQVYTVRPGDSLSKIARKKLGDGNRWPEIFELNRTVINNPNVIFPGQVLLLPAS
jgi:nucleoid-associated protein YgaU